MSSDTQDRCAFKFRDDDGIERDCGGRKGAQRHKHNEEHHPGGGNRGCHTFVPPGDTQAQAAETPLQDLLKGFAERAAWGIKESGGLTISTPVFPDGHGYGFAERAAWLFTRAADRITTLLEDNAELKAFIGGDGRIIVKLRDIEAMREDVIGYMALNKRLESDLAQAREVIAAVKAFRDELKDDATDEGNRNPYMLYGNDADVVERFDKVLPVEPGDA